MKRKAAAEKQSTPAPSAAPAEITDPRLYINRELSWLEFNRRVLEEAVLPDWHPLLERVKFLAIFAANLDEFFMIRVSGLKQQLSAGAVELPPDGMTPAEQLAAIRECLLPMLEQAKVCWHDDLIPKLRLAGICVRTYDELSPAQREWLTAYFLREVFPVLTPLVLDPGHPFPQISNLSLNLAVSLLDPDNGVQFGRVKIPLTLPRLIQLPMEVSHGGLGNGRGPRALTTGGAPAHMDFVWLEQVVAANLSYLYPGVDVVEAHPFRVTRNADMEIQEDEADDLLRSIERSLRRRRFGPVVRLEIDAVMPPHMVNLLMDNLQVGPRDVYEVGDLLGMSSLLRLLEVNRYDLKDWPFVPFEPTVLASREDIFSVIRRGDVLLHHPYDSFAPVIDFIKQAAEDPHVLAIKQTLYRVGSNSPVVEALMRARENQKQVAVLVELKARFDEENNIGWARALEREGVHVVYGLLGLKTHSKIALVVRRESDGLRRYVHLSTGNYNASTARVYTDLGLFTCNPEIGADASELFNYLTGYSKQIRYRQLAVAPVNLRSEMARLIRREIEQQRAGRPARLIFKLNALTDPQIVRLLYEASQAGVQIDLLIRGICCLRPGVPGVSDNIRVTSVVGRFLEHTRVYYFANGGQEEIYLGSADLMERNLMRRVEIVFPVLDPIIRDHIRNDVLFIYLADNVKARRLRPDGKYEWLTPGDDAPIDSQRLLLERRTSGI
jgi:polyphosphate kinase